MFDPFLKPLDFDPDDLPLDHWDLLLISRTP
ncbi:hypothetical protein A2U01_0091934, partial [Trifolium medium]|nr:hypothetical protein [Trifolium medium]